MAEPAQTSSAKELLLVEDSPVYTEILRKLVRDLGHDLQFQCTCADNADKAFAELAKKEFDLILLDYKLPGDDGLVVLDKIRKKGKTTPVIMLTGMGSEAVAVEAMKRGAYDYLSKDALDVASLVRAITSALERKRLEEQLARSQEELRLKNQQMEDDLQMAREVQFSFLPQEYPTFPSNASAKNSALLFYQRYNPTSAVGGDFFDVFAVSPTRAGVFISDVMGHGVRAALVTAILRALVADLRFLADEPGQFMTQLNAKLLGILKQTRMPLFASAFYMVLDVEKGALAFANAGHPMPLRVRRSEKLVAPLEAAETSGPALGVFPDSQYGTAQTRIQPHDVLLLYTDGVFEVLNDADEQFGEARLIETVQGSLRLPPEKMLDEVLKSVKSFSRSGDFFDDVCLMAVEVARISRSTETV
jgi:serine phosphatase RsbU (regulator of sigma subunit)